MTSWRRGRRAKKRTTLRKGQSRSSLDQLDSTAEVGDPDSSSIIIGQPKPNGLRQPRPYALSSPTSTCRLPQLLRRPVTTTPGIGKPPGETLDRLSTHPSPSSSRREYGEVLESEERSLSGSGSVSPLLSLRSDSRALADFGPFSFDLGGLLSLSASLAPARELQQIVSSSLVPSMGSYDLQLSVLIKGARGSGKRTIVRSVAAASGLGVMEVSP